MCVCECVCASVRAGVHSVAVLITVVVAVVAALLVALLVGGLVEPVEPLVGVDNGLHLARHVLALRLLPREVGRGGQDVVVEQGEEGALQHA